MNSTTAIKQSGPCLTLVTEVQALLTQLRESADLVFERGILRVAAVQVVQVDLLDAEAPSAHVRTLSQVVGIADGVNRRHVEATADEASLGRDTRCSG
jgi:hypothetical protein